MCVNHFSKYLAMTVITVVALVLMFSVFVVINTGATDGLIAVGQMVALIVEAFMP
jgi:low affinity Fe/Cu permease